jgi:hypothetical protein
MWRQSLTELLSEERSHSRSATDVRYNPRFKRGGVVVKKLAVLVICLAFCGNALAQDAKTVIANAQKALGDVKSITY